MAAATSTKTTTTRTMIITEELAASDVLLLDAQHGAVSGWHSAA
eukprot:CAMPEP_0197043830 /NCGR_PEP_ID=MMETSP1384-20130603/20025_1 /TAXON_ID=29189 /ORGANISM="Ammonia sp." /LENGTH=43 /DNA_ID= /DNA_START= /DNA_END= /DNA_ORIENTATION=